ncbi:glycosyltransferase [Candidatus Bathyarchaeota archaeon]|nr:glycosyltransferase [Candidatus Bathyarchaeota archaeon]
MSQQPRGSDKNNLYKGIRVTVGLCVKNNETTVAEAVDSIINQYYPQESMEIIVVDGNSHDKTLFIINEKIQKTHIEYKILSERMGLGFARQMVVDNALGEYIIWVDGDIILAKDYIRRQVDFMDDHLDVGVVVGTYGLSPEDNLVATLENIGYFVNSLSSKEGPTTKLLGTEASCQRTKAIREAGGFDINIRGANEDMDLSYRIRSRGWLLYENKPIFYEKQRGTWKDLWKQHFWYGYGLHYILHKKSRGNLIQDKSVDRVIISSAAYRVTHKKIVFLLPINFIFKKAALIMGFISAHFNGYGH